MYFDAWEQRERARFGSGQYADVPWMANPTGDIRGSWFRSLHGHYPHVVMEQPNMIEYTPTDKMGNADRRTQMKPGKYLRKYFPFLSDNQIAIHVAEWKATLTDTLHLAVTPKEIAAIYRDGPTFNSCMSGEKAVVDDVHPAEVYGAGDLALAHIRDAEGTVTARCICWPAKRIYYKKPYGDHETLRAALEAKGYHSAWSDRFHGARLLKIECSDGSYLCPYLDIASTVVIGAEFLRVGSYEGWTEHDAQSLHGTLGDNTSHDDETVCSNCNEWTADEEVSYVEGDYYCDECVSELFAYCEGCNEWSSMDTSTLFEHFYYCDYCIGNVSAECTLCDTRVGNDEICSTLDEQFVCNNCAEDDYTLCTGCMELIVNADVKETANGSPYCDDCMQQELDLEETDSNEDSEKAKTPWTPHD